MSALLGRIPSAVGYQPTLATDLGQLQERITTTKKGSITSVQVGLGSLLLAASLCEQGLQVALPECGSRHGAAEQAAPGSRWHGSAWHRAA